MLNSKQIGNVTELRCITAFCEQGIPVSIPYGDCERYDFIIDVNHKLLRVQVKTSKELPEAAGIEFYCRSTGYNSTGAINRSYSPDDIDYFATWHNGVTYLVPVEECSTQKKLRFTPPKNNQKVGINFAKDYELPIQLEKLKN